MTDDTSITRYLPLSCNRALVLDGLHFARQVPLFPVEQQFDLREVSRLRSGQARRISWAVLFLKAYAIVAREHSPLRQAYLRWPWPRLIEVAAQRGDAGPQSGVSSAKSGSAGVASNEPENQPLARLQSQLEAVPVAARG